MYAGREDAYPYAIHETLDIKAHDVTVHVVYEKSPLPKYLEAGLELAERFGVNLNDPLPERKRF